MVERDAAALFDAATAFIRFYQFRDRNTVLKSGLTVAQSYALGVLTASDGVSLGALAESLQLDKSTTSRLIAGMAKNGLVTWSRPEHDQRVMQIVASAEGRRRYARHRRAIEMENAKLLASYSPTARRAVIRALHQLTQRAGGAPEAAPLRR